MLALPLQLTNLLNVTYYMGKVFCIRHLAHCSVSSTLNSRTLLNRQAADTALQSHSFIPSSRSSGYRGGPAGVGCRRLNRQCCAQDYPEQRLQFFALLRAITNACFSTLFAMSPGQLKLVIDSIIWAFRHTERNVADTGGALMALATMLQY